MKVRFYQTEEVINEWISETEVPDEIYKKGEQAVLEWIKEECLDYENISIQCSQIKDAMKNIKNAKINTILRFQNARNNNQ